MKNRLSFTDGVRITLTQMLQVRDRRSERQRILLAQYAQALVSLTMVVPGEIKNSSASRFLFKTALAEASQMFYTQGWRLIKQESSVTSCGAEALFVLEANAEHIKQRCMELEKIHLLGRLWDFDVICPKKGALSRHTQGHNPRRCLICENHAHACTRSSKHTASELIAVMTGKVNHFFESSR